MLEAMLTDAQRALRDEMRAFVRWVPRDLILEMDADEIVKIDTGPQDPVVLKVEGVPKFLGMPGVVKGNRAVQITDKIKKEEGD